MSGIDYFPNEKYLYGSFYSTSLFIVYYMVRLEPFTYLRNFKITQTKIFKVGYLIMLIDFLALFNKCGSVWWINLVQVTLKNLFLNFIISLRFLKILII